MEVCDEEQKATLKKYMGMTVAERKEIVDDAEKAVADLEEKFKSDVAELQATYGRLQKDKDNILKSVNTKELQLLKTIR
jgi:chlorite dismutase